MEIENKIEVGDVLSTGGFCTGRNWVVEKISKGFATMTELQWSQDLTNEPGGCRRTERTLRRKIKGGYPYCKQFGRFDPKEGITVMPSIATD